jgi:gluconokinase
LFSLHVVFVSPHDLDCCLLSLSTRETPWEQLVPQLRVFYKTSTATPVHLWLTLSSYIVSRWLGQWSSSAPISISVSEASWTGLLNVHTCEWDGEVLSHLPPSCVSALPPLQDFTTQTFFGVSKYRKDESEVINPYWSRWPELREEEGCQIFLGVGDGAAATIGSKCYSTSTTSKRISVTIGTSAAIRLCRNYPRYITPCNTADNVSPTRENKALLKIQEGLWCYRITNDLVILGGALTDGGSVIEFCRTLLNLKEDSEFTSCMEQVQTLMQQQQQQQQQQSDSNDSIGHTSTYDNLLSAADSTEIFLPFLGGERSIGFRPGATASLCGISHRTTPARIMKSCMEGVTIQLNEILMLLLNSLEGEISEAIRPKLVVSGSALERNQTWRQMIADCTELDVVMDSEVNECTSRGVAMLIATTLVSQWQKSTSDNEASKCFMFAEEEIIHPIDVCYPSVSNTYWSKKKNLQKELINSVSRTWVPSLIDKPTM